jgi:LuxR family quorum-sensing system transcriptional regulator CciR
MDSLARLGRNDEMPAFAAAIEFARTMSEIRSRQALSDALQEASSRMGMRFFALSHHVDFATAPGLRIHNYPDGWEQWYDANRLGITDPVHRTSQTIMRAFHWREMSDLITLFPSDRRLLERGRRMGLGEGVTVPAHLPGHARGSCTFVAAAGEALTEAVPHWAQSIGAMASEAARKILRGKQQPQVRVSERQRECIALAGRGLSNKEIAETLGIGEQTVLEHLRTARAKLEVGTRVELVISLLVRGELCLDDLIIALPKRGRIG